MKKFLFCAIALVSIVHADTAQFGKTHFIIGQPTQALPFGDAPRAASVPLLLHPHTCVLFSPDDDMRKALCTLIEREQEAIHVAMYMFTDKDIAQALVTAQERGVRVELVIDAGCLRERHNKISVLCQAGCTVYIYNPSHRGADVNSLMHHKFAIFHKNEANASKIWTGSFNFTKAGREMNQENVVVLSDGVVVKQFQDQFEKLKRRSHRYGNKQQT